METIDYLGKCENDTGEIAVHYAHETDGAGSFMTITLIECSECGPIYQKS